MELPKRIPALLRTIGLNVAIVHAKMVRNRLLDPPSRPCPKCGYDLRASHSRCPECGTAIQMGQSN